MYCLIRQPKIFIAIFLDPDVTLSKDMQSKWVKMELKYH